LEQVELFLGLGERSESLKPKSQIDNPLHLRSTIRGTMEKVGFQGYFLLRSILEMKFFADRKKAAYKADKKVFS